MFLVDQVGDGNGYYIMGMSEHHHFQADQGLMSESRLNVLGGPLRVCSTRLIGFVGVGKNDSEVCVTLTKSFMSFLATRAFKFSDDFLQDKEANLRVSSHCNVPVKVWYEAYKAGCAPSVVLESTPNTVHSLIFRPKSL